jgi:hypothetical protein
MMHPLPAILLRGKTMASSESIMKQINVAIKQIKALTTELTKNPKSKAGALIKKEMLKVKALEKQFFDAQKEEHAYVLKALKTAGIG